MDNRDENLFEKVNQLKTILVEAATGTPFQEIEDKYQDLRAYLISTNIGSRLPEFVHSCRELIDFWDFIKSELGNSRYTDRRKFLNEKFRSLLTELEIGLSNPGGEPIMLQGEDSTSIKPYCFVIMSFSENPELEDAYKLGIKSIVEDLGFECIRVDEVEHNKRITDVIIEHIENASFIVAELTEERPNCYYEIGYAHALRKNVIPTLKKGNDIPFDLKDYNFIIYKNISELQERLKKRISATVQADTPNTSNPVSQVMKSGAGRQREQLDEFRKLIGEIDYALINYASAYSNPGVSSNASEAQKELRRLASQLKAAFRVIPSEWRIEGDLPPEKDVMDASGRLMRLSNIVLDQTFFERDSTGKGLEVITEDPKMIRKLLRIKNGENS